MKRNTNFCIFILIILLFVLLLLVLVTRYRTESKSKQNKPFHTTEEVTEMNESEAVIESGKEETSCKYLIRSDEGRLSVYLPDGCTLYMNTGIPTDLLPAGMQKQAQNGIRFSSEQELMDFLESYSS